jgi:hypothetical protein
MASGRDRFVSTGSLAVSVLSGPPLSATTLIIAMEVVASERAFLTDLGPGPWERV